MDKKSIANIVDIIMIIGTLVVFFIPNTFSCIFNSAYVTYNICFIEKGIMRFTEIEGLSVLALNILTVCNEIAFINIIIQLLRYFNVNGNLTRIKQLQSMIQALYYLRIPYLVFLASYLFENIYFAVLLAVFFGFIVFIQSRIIKIHLEEIKAEIEKAKEIEKEESKG